MVVLICILFVMMFSICIKEGIFWVNVILICVVFLGMGKLVLYIISVLVCFRWEIIDEILELRMVFFFIFFFISEMFC